MVSPPSYLRKPHFHHQAIQWLEADQHKIVALPTRASFRHSQLQATQKLKNLASVAKMESCNLVHDGRTMMVALKL